MAHVTKPEYPDPLLRRRIEEPTGGAPVGPTNIRSGEEVVYELFVEYVARVDDYELVIDAAVQT